MPDSSPYLRALKTLLLVKRQALVADGTVSISAENFWALVAQRASRLPGAPRGTNAAWSAKRDMLHIIASTPRLASFVNL